LIILIPETKDSVSGRAIISESQSVGFIEKFGLWTDEHRRLAQDLKERLEKGGLKLVRVVWADSHGIARAKTLALPAFLGALESGFNINVATTTLDASGARVFSSFVRGGGMGLEEMTGSPNLVVVPDPRTFRGLPWEPNVGWILCDEYFVDGRPFHFSTRHLLRKQLQSLENLGLRSVVGLEIEWYLARNAEPHLSFEHVGRPGLRGRAVMVTPAEPGFSLHSESNLDQIYDVVTAVADACEHLNLPLRSIENEWGPGQLECTFAPRDALETADNVILFRSAVRQIARRLGYVATFMTRPMLKNFYSSGWHLHQSLVDIRTGKNTFIPSQPGEHLSETGNHYLGGLLKHGLDGLVFASPTVNGYRRFRANSLAPDRVAWGSDHRGAMLRVLSGVGDPASRIENRVGEPSANPYLYIASQLVAGMDGIANRRQPGPPDTDPYASDHPMLSKSLSLALGNLERSELLRSAFGDLFVDYYVKLKRTEFGRFEAFLKEAGQSDDGETTTAWEHDEYFDNF
jgi:glutamine synthetase